MQSFPVASHFNIVKDSDSLTGEKKIFYIDQLGPRILHISEEIDHVYEEQHLKIVDDDHETTEFEHISTDTDSDMSQEGAMTPDIGTTRSGWRRTTTADLAVQTTFQYEGKPSIRYVRNCTP